MSSTIAPRNNVRIALISVGVAVGMAGVAYASVPLYRIFCQVTGFAGTTQVRVAGPTAEQRAAAGGKMIKVRFDGNVRNLPWSFTPVENRAELPIGEQRLAFYRATNSGDTPVTGTATFNVTPVSAGRYFVKMQCFCFNEQTLEPGQTVDMPVVYFIDPAILDDPDTNRITEITLSYTFFPVENPERAPGIYATGDAGVAPRTG